MSTDRPTALRIDDAHAPTMRRRRGAVLVASGAGLVALGLAAGLMWRPMTASPDGWRTADPTSVASAATMEPTSAGVRAAAPAPNAATGQDGEMAGRGAPQGVYAPWSEPGSPAVWQSPAAQRQGAESRSRLAEAQAPGPRPQVAPWRPIQPRQSVDGSHQASDGLREASQPSPAGDPRAEVAAPVVADAPPREPPRPMACSSCGVVQAVRPVPLAGEPSGLGAIAGGVVGGLLGNQVGSGNGRSAMTVLGAVGGGVAGHEVEKRVRGVTAYEVQIRMDDGTSRTLRQRTSPAAGSRVRVEGDDLRPVAGEELRALRTGQL